MKVSLDPINKFNYNQLDNHGFYMVMVDDSLRAITTPFMCKDYIQDMFWALRTGKDGAEVYGMLVRSDMLTEEDFYKIALVQRGNNLKEYAERIQGFINFLDDAQGITRTKVQTTDDDYTLLVTFHRDWTQNGPMLSAFTTAVRLGGAYAIGESPVDFMNRIHEEATWCPDDEEYDEDEPNEVDPAWSTVDAARLDVTMPKFSALLKGHKVVSSWTDFTNVYVAHDTGIYDFSRFPEVD